MQLRRLDGTVAASGVVPRFSNAKAQPAPRLPKTIRLPAASEGRDRVEFLTVGAVKGGGRYRVRASIEPQLQSYVLLIAARVERAAPRTEVGRSGWP